MVSSSSFAFCQTAPGPQLVRDVRVFDGKHVLEHRSVLIENGRIRWIRGSEAASPNAEVIQGSGRTLLPGLFDAHVHMPVYGAEAAAHQALVLGVTTQLDMGGNAGQGLKNIKKIESEDRPDLADLRTAGSVATVPGGHPTQMGGPPTPTLTGPGEAEAFVDARIGEGSDYIKIIHDDGSTWPWTKDRVPMLDNPTMRALVEAAHKRGKLAVVHALSEQQARDAIAAGADGLAHLFYGDSVSVDFVALAAKHHVFVIPTLSANYLNCGKSEGPAILADPRLGPHINQQWLSLMSMPKSDPSVNHLCAGADEAIRKLAKAGVPILTGTDAPAPGTAYGASVHGELELLVRDGLAPAQALAAATSVPARVFRLPDRGRISPGLRADLLLVSGDPTKNILDTRNIVAVWKRGAIVIFATGRFPFRAHPVTTVSYHTNGRSQHLILEATIRPYCV
jgi:imidazolonepropionase-like amidohydrolase